MQLRKPHATQLAITGYGVAIGIMLISTLIAWLLSSRLTLVNLIMIYLIGVVIVSARSERIPSIVAALLGVALFDYLFLPPLYSFAFTEPQYVVNMAALVIVAVTISGLTYQIRLQIAAVREREQRTANLLELSRILASRRDLADVVTTSEQFISKLIGRNVILILPDVHGALVGSKSLTPDQHGLAEWVYRNGHAAGPGTDTLPGTNGLYLPLVASSGTAGVLLIVPIDSTTISTDQITQLSAFANQTGTAIERARLADQAETARVQVETERLRSTLLSSVSHDLRTPLASITGAVSSILEGENTLSSEDRRELAQLALEETERLNRLVINLLNMTRLESGGLHVHKEWQPLEEVVGATITRLEKQISDHPLIADLPLDLPLVPIDSVLIDQVLTNLLENAAKYTPPGTPIALTAHADPNLMTVEVADSGPGLPAGEEDRIFDKFYRLQPQSNRGAGLGLAICRGIIEAHGGRIWAENRPEGGAVFRFTLPLDGKPPEIVAENLWESRT